MVRNLMYFLRFCVLNNFLWCIFVGEKTIGKLEMKAFSQLRNFKSKRIPIFHHFYNLRLQVIIVVTLKNPVAIVIAPNVFMPFFYI